MTSTPARITWILGPPGAGKSTYAAALGASARVVEFNDMLAPLVAPGRMRKGVFTANGMLIAIVRHLEFHPDNIQSMPLVVVAGAVPEEALFPLGEGEEAWLLLPERDRWEAQLRGRPAPPNGNVYDDYAYSKVCYDRFTDWLARGLPLRRFVPDFQSGLIGKVPI